MTKQSYQEEFDKIEVPKSEVRLAIKAGMDRLPVYKVKKRYPKKFAIGAAVLVTAATIGLFTVPLSVLEAFAALPGVNQIIAFRGGSTGAKLEQMGYTEEPGVMVSDGGITLKIEKTYYDAGELGILYSYTLPADFEGDAGFYLNVDLAGELGSTSSEWEPVEFNAETQQYEGTLIVTSPEILLGDTGVLPVVLLDAYEKNDVGNLRIDVPVTQLETQTKELKQKQMTPDGLEVSLDKLIVGKSVSAVEYSVVQSKSTIAAAFMDFYRNDGTEFAKNMSGELVAKEDLGAGLEKQIYRAGFSNEAGLENVSAAVKLVYQPESISHLLTDSQFIYQSEKTSRNYQVVATKLEGDNLLVDIKVAGTDQSAADELTRLVNSNNLLIGTSRYTDNNGHYSWEEIRDEPGSFYLKYFAASEVLDAQQKILRFTYNTNETGRFGEVEMSKDYFNLALAQIQINISPDTTTYEIPEHYQLNLTKS